MNIYGVCRFSFFGRTDTGSSVGTEEDAHRLLWNEQRMAVRFHLFENLLLPSIWNQDDNNFKLIVLTSKDMPDPYQERLDRAVANVPTITVLRVATRDIGHALKPMMLEASNDRRDRAAYFRVDDDDALATCYIRKLRAIVEGLPNNTMISFPTGVMGFTDGDTARHREYSKTAIAIGLAVVKPPEATRNLFQIQHLRHFQKSPHYSDPTFPAYHYTRHSTNNTNGYDRPVHYGGGMIADISRKAREAHPEFAAGAATTETAEQMITDAFPWTDGPSLRAIVAATQYPERLSTV